MFELPSSPTSTAVPDGPEERESARHVTLKDIAQKAGVHFTTVSLALRGHPSLLPATRARILEIAGELGYRRDPVFMALTSRRANAQTPHKVCRMAFLTDEPSQNTFERASHMRYFYDGARQQAERMGYTCDLMFIRGQDFTPDTLEVRLRNQGYEGVIIGAFHFPNTRIVLDWERYALVKIDTQFMEPDFAFVSNDQMHAVRLAWQQLRQRGYRRIGMAVGRYDEIATRDLYSAGCLIEQAGLPPEDRIPPLHFDYADRVQEADPKLRAWVRQYRPQVVVSNWSEILPMAVATGLRVPEELACACLCLSDPDPRVAGVIQNHHAVGRRAAEMLAIAAKSEQRGIPARPAAVRIAGRWQDGASAPGIP